MHLANSRGKQAEPADKAARKAARFALSAARRMIDPSTKPRIDSLRQDHRFDDPGGRTWPFDLLYHGFPLTQRWWHNATTGVDGDQPPS